MPQHTLSQKAISPKVLSPVQTYSVAIVYISWRDLVMTCIYRYSLYGFTRDINWKIYAFQRIYSLKQSSEFSYKMSSTVGKWYV